MAILRKNKTETVRGFRFHLPGGYPEPDNEQLIKALNTHYNVQLDNYSDRQTVRSHYGTEVEMEYIYEHGGAGRWQVKEVFFSPQNA